jgi:hypothetical protein
MGREEKKEWNEQKQQVSKSHCRWCVLQWASVCVRATAKPRLKSRQAKAVEEPETGGHRRDTVRSVSFHSFLPRSRQ